LENGLHVPDDLSILATNENETMPFTTSSLTAVVQPIDETVARAFEILQGLMAGHVPEQPQVVLMPRLACRESTGKPQKR
jgi:DNA-binding LacI/PurR family transcriptional regulator